MGENIAHCIHGAFSHRFEPPEHGMSSPKMCSCFRTCRSLKPRIIFVSWDLCSSPVMSAMSSAGYVPEMIDLHVPSCIIHVLRRWFLVLPLVILHHHLWGGIYIGKYGYVFSWGGHLKQIAAAVPQWWRLHQETLSVSTSGLEVRQQGSQRLAWKGGTSADASPGTMHWRQQGSNTSLHTCSNRFICCMVLCQLCQWTAGQGHFALEGFFYADASEKLRWTLVSPPTKSLTLDNALMTDLSKVTFPSNLESLTFSDHFNQSLNGVNFPSNLQNLTFGSRFNQVLNGVNFPRSLRSLSSISISSSWLSVALHCFGGTNLQFQGRIIPTCSIMYFSFLSCLTVTLEPPKYAEKSTHGKQTSFSRCLCLFQNLFLFYSNNFLRIDTNLANNIIQSTFAIVWNWVSFWNTERLMGS